MGVLAYGTARVHMIGTKMRRDIVATALRINAGVACRFLSNVILHTMDFDGDGELVQVCRRDFSLACKALQVPTVVALECIRVHAHCTLCGI